MPASFPGGGYNNYGQVPSFFAKGAQLEQQLKTLGIAVDKAKTQAEKTQNPKTDAYFKNLLARQEQLTKQKTAYDTSPQGKAYAASKELEAARRESRTMPQQVQKEYKEKLQQMKSDYEVAKVTAETAPPPKAAVVTSSTADLANIIAQKQSAAPPSAQSIEAAKAAALQKAKADYEQKIKEAAAQQKVTSQEKVKEAVAKVKTKSSELQKALQEAKRPSPAPRGRR